MKSEIILAGLLAWMAIMDYRKKEIPVRLLLLSAGIGAICLLCQMPLPWPACLFRFLPGAVLILTAVVSGGKIGCGDGCVFLITGLFLPTGQNLGLLIGSFFIAALAGVVLLMKRKAKAADAFPFVPCVFAAYMIGLVFRIGVIICQR